jgi:preprotein translocase subunit SecG
LRKVKVEIYFSIAQIVLAVALVGAVLLQVRGGGLGGIFGQPDSVYRTRRGLEKTLFQFTIVLVALFVIVSLLTLRFG